MQGPLHSVRVDRPRQSQILTAGSGESVVEPWDPEHALVALNTHAEYLAGGRLHWLFLARHPHDPAVVSDEVGYRDLENLGKIMHLQLSGSFHCHCLDASG